MKTLSIQQPWASLICAGIKDVENRTWKAAEIPGKILIHASSKKVTQNFFSEITEEMESHICNHVFFGNLPHLDELPTSAIVGYVTVSGFETEYTGSVWDGGPLQIKWKLEDAWMFDEPILNIRGKLHLFDYDLDENNLPPAHKVELRQVALEGDEVIIPTTDDHIDRIIKEKTEIIEVYVTEENLPILCEQTNDGFDFKSHKTIKFEGESISVRFKLEENTGIYWTPDPNDETKPLEIEFHDGSWGQWQVYQFVLGKMIGDGPFVEFCGGKVITSPEIDRIIKSK